MHKKKTNSFRALRDLPPPSQEQVKKFQDGFSERLRQHELRFAQQGAVEQISDRWMERSYDL